MSLADDKSIFRDAELSIVVPRRPDGLDFPATTSDSTAIDEWLRQLHLGSERDCCFYGMCGSSVIMSPN